VNTPLKVTIFGYNVQEMETDGKTTM